MEAVTRGHYSSIPIAMPSKAPTGANYYPVSRVAGSPPEISDASTTTGSATGDYDSSLSYPSVDVIEMLGDRMGNVFDPSRLDKGVVKQAQLSGKLNDKQRELLELQALAKRRIKSARANFADGVRAAKETKNDLEWAQKRVSAMKMKAERNLPDEYRRATNRYTYNDDF